MCVCVCVQGALQRITRDTGKLATEQLKGLTCQIVKQMLFNCRCNPHAPPGAAPAEPAPAAAGTEASNMEM